MFQLCLLRLNTLFYVVHVMEQFHTMSLYSYSQHAGVGSSHSPLAKQKMLESPSNEYPTMHPNFAEVVTPVVDKVYSPPDIVPRSAHWTETQNILQFFRVQT